MSRSWSFRGQTEPVAALVAIVVMVLALGLYSGFLADVLRDRTDRSPEASAIDRIWADASHGGTFAAHRPTGLDDVEPDSLPQGRNVHVEVTAVTDDGDRAVVATEQFGADGTPVDDPEGPPADGSGIETGVAERPVPVEVAPGDVRGGTLRVEVWSP
ncbi:hypothetical protein Htur_2696 [Haloterrigena turkmenica DSM 5511]|uniref:Uncharacterized protein n=1 Tax=Haloterrigena turkmenica (strain ATCC 51198 / DSM 5511 / JCM 9101 / NCIMB 13204 / VKM B-1734 / 4k) TaxID=543526 RepID=D2RWR9_HALTV|nr:hypothetical protein [Haloterrigena turkmenica]ADB61570.1 hypothetical protein Htur_2696 [Haloterrigena turkmenica DSM 5511]